MYCNKCETEKGEEEFSKNKSSKIGYNSTCKECTRILTRRHYEKNRHDYKIRQENRRLGNMERINELKSLRGCEKCGENRHYVLDFHHIDPKNKDFSIGLSGNYSWDRLENEISKCMVVCANCHREIHYLEQQKECR